MPIQEGPVKWQFFVKMAENTAKMTFEFTAIT
jgi:hypothetical protein